ncbi:PTS fructose transporter subunit IIB [Clostridioides difficile]
MKIVAVTSCLTGIAHTYLAAEALEKHAKANGFEIKVETQGAIGTENMITLEEAKSADLVILTNDIEIDDIERFEGKHIIQVSVKDLVMRANDILKDAEKYINNIEN